MRIHERAIERNNSENLFGWPTPSTYPDQPGWKEWTTSRQAAEAIAPVANRLRDRVLSFIRTLAPGEALTADQIATRVGRSPLSVRPRISELAAAGLIQRGDERQKNESGMTAATWRPA